MNDLKIMKTNRNLTLDYLKAFAIILVVFGHCLRYGLGKGNDIFDNNVMKFIYSFHMPLFMLISGYLFGFSIQKHTLKENFINKIKTLMIPIAIWTIPITLIDMILDYLLALSETICSIAVCLILIFGIKKVKILNMLLLGGR